MRKDTCEKIIRKNFRLKIKYRELAHVRNFYITTLLELKIGTQNNLTRLYLRFHFQ